MLLRPELIERLADTLEGIAMSNARDTGLASREANILIYHTAVSDGGGAVAGESPLLEINLIEQDGDACVVVTSALGIVELHGVEEIRLLAATEEAAFYSRPAKGKLSVLTIGSRGAIQVYMNISEALGPMELSEVGDEDLRAAVALKIFAEHTEVFRNEE